ncbi:bifunctional NAD(P)/FAD-dependent oxidoreductase/class I SAM-dependent methyltransferase [Cumulibacter manganitolerans]|uniref:bifunctional NAD(P)/FAD-dependent oxidoreductase/class I SAM-dependent methyltransferase n=1 Tax=Cumulibacter manganitolerans TaxID=1884992 RepID=UPI001294A937|nr:bifunctional NAD(P)/FAD-dependent oxidoreductase/class I SAM-dependent methyltransferase [Cumulibacter manganitolerans]
MPNHTVSHIDRHCDVAVIGASAAGLAGALQLARQRRAVLLIDSGEPRNAPATHLHSYLGYEGRPPTELLAAGRDDLRRYGAEILSGRAITAERLADGAFRVTTQGGHAIIARRVLAATGIVDRLPAIDGLTEHWGTSVIHCPFCHGYEVRDRRVVQIADHPAALHTAALFRQLTDRHTLVLHPGVDRAAEELGALRGAGVRIVEAVARRVLSENGRLTAVELGDGTVLGADAVAISSAFAPRIEPFAALGPRTTAHPSGLGEVVERDALGETSVAGLYAAGNLVDPGQQVLQAAADGSKVGAAIAYSLANEDIADAARRSATAEDWDARYATGQMWSGRPNGALVAEVSGLRPGRALDVGAGEGGDAVWLAERGWQVTATDISTAALSRLSGHAADRGVAVACVRADANAVDPFRRGGFDLVTAHYASIPRTPDDRAAGNLMSAVAAGGTLLVVAHDPEPMRQAARGHEGGVPFDPDAYLSTDNIAAAITTSADWVLETHERRPRPHTATGPQHHVDDIVLRARRLA